MDTETSIKSIVYKDNIGETKTNYKDLEDVDLEITRNNILLPLPYLVGNSVPKNIASMVKFDIIQSSLSTNLAAIINQKFLSSVASWKYSNMRDIFIKMSEVDHIWWVVNNWFGLKAQLWQVHVLVNITIKKRDVYAIISTNTNKSLVYQVILVVTKDFILVISPIIAFIGDQIRVVLYYSC